MRKITCNYCGQVNPVDDEVELHNVKCSKCGYWLAYRCHSCGGAIKRQEQPDKYGQFHYFCPVCG